MHPIKIDVIQLGESKHNEVYKFIKKLIKKPHSNIYNILTIEKVGLPDSDFLGYSDSSLQKLICVSGNADITICFIDYPLDDNYFVRRLSKNIVVATFFETSDIFNKANINLINFVLLIFLDSSTLFMLNKDYVDFDKYIYIPFSVNQEDITNGYKSMEINAKRISKYAELHHYETRGCLFDMCGLKEDITISASNPKICYECETKLRKIILPLDFIDELKKELKQIKKSFYYVITDWIKKHPFLSLIILSLATITINIISSIIYKLIKPFFYF